MADEAQKNRLLAALSALGDSAGDAKLCGTLGWDERTYEMVKRL